MEESKMKMKELISIEDKNYTINQLKIQSRWREIMKLAKTAELKNQSIL
jgi:hypothetical protein